MAAVPRATVLLRLCLCPVLCWQNIPSLRFSSLDLAFWRRKGFFVGLFFVFLLPWITRGWTIGFWKKRGLALKCVHKSSKAEAKSLVHCLPIPDTPASPKLLGRAGWGLQPLLPHRSDGEQWDSPPGVPYTCLLSEPFAVC